MEFKQKAEEKKMSMSKNIARLAVTAGLTAALSFGGVMAPVTMAFAEGATGSITINKVAEDNKDNTFKAYQIFKAKVDDVKDRGKVASDIKWANEAISSKVIAAIQGSTEYKKLVDENSAEPLADNAAAPVVAEWLSQNVKGIASTESSSEGTRVAPGDVLYEIAAAVSGMKQGVDPETSAGSLTADTLWTRPSTTGDGYYLFVPDGLADPTKPNTGKPNTSTSPIFAIVGGNPVVVTEKTSIPTVTKKVKNDGGSDWADKADSQMGQDVKYQLTGTVADNIATFGTYYYEFHDELSAGLTADVNTIVVTIDGATVEAANNYILNVKDTKDQSGAVTGQVLTVSFGDLKAAARSVNKTLTKDSHVVVTYKAKLDPKKAKNVKVGGDGNLNSVRLIYSNNPMSDGRGESVPDTVRDYTYALQLVKEDFDDHSKKLENVEFTIKATGADELASGVEGTQFVQGDGSLGDDAHRFTTDSNGVISVKGLDAGTYTVEEVKTPSGYNTVPKFTFTIKADGLGKKEGEVFEGASDPNTLKITGTTPASDLVNIDGVQTDGTVTLTVKNKKGSNLPLTGLNGVTFTWIAGGAVLCIGVAHLIRSRKQAEESEQE